MKHYIITAILLALFLGLFSSMTINGQVATAIPEAQTDLEAVEIPRIIYGHEPELKNNILFTIDDCYSEEKTRDMFEFLKEHGMSATFFVISSVIAEHDPELWQEIAEAGFEIGYHTRYHQDGLTIAQLDADFAAFTEDIRAILDDPDYAIHYVRPPWGIWDINWLTWAEDNDLHTVRWNIVTRFDLTTDYFEGVLKHEEGGGIVLLHPRPTDMWWLEENIDALLQIQNAGDNDRPYHFVTLTEAFND